MIEVRTERLLLRRWRDEDRAIFAAINADPDVMRYFPGSLTREQSDALADSIELGWDDRGFGLWAVEVPGRGPLRWVRRTERPDVHTARSSAGRGGLAPRQGALGQGLCHRSWAGLAPVRIRRRVGRDRLVHHRTELAITPGHGAAWDAATTPTTISTIPGCPRTRRCAATSSTGSGGIEWAARGFERSAPTLVAVPTETDVPPYQSAVETKHHPAESVPWLVVDVSERLVESSCRILGDRHSERSVRFRRHAPARGLRS